MFCCLWRRSFSSGPAWRPYDRADLVAGGLARNHRRRYSDIHLLAFSFHHARLYPVSLHMMLLCVGGHYTYARVPLFQWLQPMFRLASQPLRSARAFHAGLRPGAHRARVFRQAAIVTRPAGGFVHHHLNLHGDQRALRTARMATALVARRGRRTLFSAPRATLGHAGGHVHGPDRGALRARLL